MLIRGPFILNGKRYSRASLLQFASAQMNDPGAPAWKIALYQFISDLFDKEKPLVQQTSGTTGEPKSIVLKREAMLVSAQRTLDHFGLKPGDAALLCLPVQYIAGKMMVVRALLGGLNLVTVEPSGNLAGTLEKALDKILEKDMNESSRTRETGLEDHIDFAAMVPLQVYELLKSPGIFSRIRKLIIGGGEIDPSMRKMLRTIQGTEIYETFAMSETYTHFATRRLNAPGNGGYPKEQHAFREDSKNPGMGKSRIEPSGTGTEDHGHDSIRPGSRNAGTEPEDSFQVMDGARTTLDERGCLVVDIPGVTSGPVISNDLAELTGSGSFKWLGRIDNVIKTGGIKVIPETIEAVVKELTGREAVVLPVSDTRLGQRLLLVIEGSPLPEREKNPSGDSPGYGESTGDKVKNSPEAHLMKSLQPHLAKHELPKEVRYLPEFPRNSSMKVDRAAIQRVLGID